MGKSTNGNTDVTPRGTASATHHTSIHAAALSTATLSSGMPKDDVATHVTAANAGPNTCLIAEAFMDARIARPPRVPSKHGTGFVPRGCIHGTGFWGNPACVMPLTAWLEDEVLLALAQENAVAETAFLVQKKPDATTFAGSPRTWKWTCVAMPPSPQPTWS